MNSKRIDALSLFIAWITLLAVGLFISITKMQSLQLVIAIISFGLIISGVYSIAYIFFAKKRRRELKISSAIVGIAIGVFLISYQNISLSILPILFACYTLFNAIVKFIEFSLYRKEKIKGNTLTLIESLLLAFFGITLMFSPLLHIDDVMLIIGIYCVLYSFTFLSDFFREILPQRTKNRLKRKVRVSLPVFMVAFAPKKMLKVINEYLNNMSEPDDIPDYEDKKVDQEPDVEVFVHVTESGFGSIGHVDIGIDDYVVSFGNYDSDSLRLFDSIGDGVLFIANKSKYIPYCIKSSQKTLISYGLSLSDKQKKEVVEYINTIIDSATEWKPKYQVAVEKDNTAQICDYDDYASNLFYSTDAKLFKFNSGKMKKYFVLGTNCVKIADSVLGKAGTDILKINGIISPGSYLDFLEHEFCRKNSMVITKRIYN